MQVAVDRVGAADIRQHIQTELLEKAEPWQLERLAALDGLTATIIRLRHKDPRFDRATSGIIYSPGEDPQGLHHHITRDRLAGLYSPNILEFTVTRLEDRNGGPYAVAVMKKLGLIPPEPHDWEQRAFLNKCEDIVEEVAFVYPGLVRIMVPAD